MQVNCDVSVDTKHQTVQGVAFPLSQAAIGELRRLQAGKITYVQLVCIRCFNIWTFTQGSSSTSTSGENGEGQGRVSEVRSVTGKFLTVCNIKPTYSH